MSQDTKYGFYSEKAVEYGTSWHLTPDDQEVEITCICSDHEGSEYYLG
jgi:hypothetical protein